MICPQCKAEYRQEFTRCADCEVELVENYVEAMRHPLAKKAAVSEKYGTRLWRGEDAHFYLELLWSLWDKKVACYGVPENLPIPESVTWPHPGTSEPAGFEVWISEENLQLAKWILDSHKAEYEKRPPEERSARGMVRQLSSETAGVCPLCSGEFTTASSFCPNCGVPLHSPQADIAAEESARRLCNLNHPKFIAELRAALQRERIRFNNANSSSGNIISGRYYIPNYEVLVLDVDLERATRVMAQVLQHWEFEPGSGFGIGLDRWRGYWPVRATENGWLREDISVLIWSDQNLVVLEDVGMALQENEIPYRIETEQVRTAKVFCHPEDETRAREIVQEVLEGPPLE